MSDPFLPRAGGTQSADIAVPDHEREVRFYSRVLGTGERPLWREDLMNNLGAPIIGLGARVPEYEHLPLQWMPHIQVIDVAASVERALHLGGTELMHGKDDEGRSQWAVLLDPGGAAFGIVPVVPAEAASPASVRGTRAGHISGLHLTVPDAAAIRDFYADVVGWTVQEIEMESGGERYANYRMIDTLGDTAAEISHARGDHAGLPAVWVVCLPVDDLAESIRRVPEEGGQIIHTTSNEEGADAHVVVKDPVGAYLSLASG